MNSPTYLRHPGVLLTAVIATIAFVWFALGYPVQMPRSPLAAGEKLDCLAYAPVTTTDSNEPAISLARIERDLQRLQPQSACIRTYAVGLGLDNVLPIARRLGLTVLQGIAIGRDAARNQAEIDRAIELSRSDRAGIRAIIVGSEALSRGAISADQLGPLIMRVREATKLPVSYADRWDVWLSAGSTLAPLVDFITIHIPLYDAEYPVAAADAARIMLDARTKVAARFSAKQVTVGEIGWPSRGRMREAALPSPANQAAVWHEVVAAAKSRDIRISLFEAYDEPARVADAGIAAAYWGLMDPDTGANKYRWGQAVSNHPRWFYQGLLGMMLALVVFAGAYLAARSVSTGTAAAADWRPIAVVALAGGLVFGWAVEEIAVPGRSALAWLQSGILIALAAATPPTVAAAVIRRAPFEGFSALLNPAARRLINPLTQIASLLFVLVVIVAIQLALGLVFDPVGREFYFAAVTGPALALLVLSLSNPRRRREGAAETTAALLLAACAVFIVFNETFWNWQALWFAAALLVLALACWRPRVARSS